MSSIGLQNFTDFKKKHGHSGLTLFLIALGSIAGMISYIFFRQALEPNLPTWESDIVTVIFGSFVSTAIAYFVLQRNRLLHKRAVAELIEKEWTQEALLESEARYRQLFELSPQPMWVYDLETHKFLAVNNSAVRHYGYSQEEFAQMTIKDVILTKEHVVSSQVTVKSLSPGYHTPRIWRHRKKNGSQIDVEILSHTLDFGSKPANLVLVHDVTEVKRVERILIESESELRVMFGALTDIILVFDADGRYLKVAPTNSKSRYKSPAELLGKTVHEIFPADHAEFMLKNIRLALEQKQMQNVEYKLDFETHSVWFEGRVSPLSNETVFWISRDITERKKAEELLNTQKELLRNVIDTNPSLIFIKNNLGVYKLANKAHAEAYDAKPENLIGKTDKDFNPNRQEVEFYLQKDQQLIESGKELFIPEERITDKNGAFRWVQTVKRVIVLPDSDQLHVLGICTDITERKKAEEKLRESEERCRELFENATDIVYVVDLEGNFISFNKAGERATGYSFEELTQKINFRQIVAPECWEIVASNLKKKVAGEISSAVYEIEIVAKDGRHIPLEISTRLVKTDEQVIGIQGICRDVSERKKLEAQLRESEKKFQEILGAMNEVVWSVRTKDSVVNYVSPAVETVYGRPAVEFWQDSRLWQKVTHPDDRQISDNFTEELRRGGKAEVEYRILRPSNDIRWVHSRAQLINDANGEPVRIDGITIDITERKQLEEQLRQAQKLESVGQLAAGIAHEINTPLQYVGDNTRFLKEAFCDLTAALKKQDDLLAACRAGTVNSELLTEVERARELSDVEFLSEEIPASLGQSLEGIERVTRIVQSMKDFAHPGASEMKAVNLNKAIESTITVASNEWKYVAEMITDFDQTMPPVVCMSGEINQVILNLIINAVHTINDVFGDGSQGKGRITVQTRHDQETAEIRISDTGKGIPAEIREKIFDPFFTTKEVGRGTGQGLAISHRVISKHGGNLQFETEIGRGTTFIIRLPINNQNLQQSMV